MRKEKGSIAIFVLVALLFMSAFLIISFANNINKSKTAKEQFNIISEIYAYANGEEGAYDKAYSDLRKKNKQTMTAYSENSDTLELTKTFDENMSNYRIYGNSVQNGTPTPEAPIEVESVGDFINYCNATEENIIDYRNYTSYEFSDGKIITTGNTLVGFVFPVNPNTQYTLSAQLTVPTEWVNFRVREYSIRPTSYEDEANFIEQQVNTRYRTTERASATITTSSTTTYMMIAIYTVTPGIEIYDFMATLGDTLQEYAPYGKYRIPVKISAKNIFNEQGVSGSVVGNGTAEKIKNGWRVEGNYGDPSATKYANGWFRPGARGGATSIEKGKTVTISADIKLTKLSENLTNNNYTLIYLYGTTNTTSSVKHYLELNTVVRVQQSFTTTVSGEYYPLFTLNNNELEITNIQIEKGNIATDYEQYQEPITTNIYLDEPLRKVGDYADYIDFNTGKVVRNVGEYKITGNEIWSKYSTVNCYYITNVIPTKYEKDINCLSNKYKGQVSGSGQSYSSGNAWIQSTETYKRFYLADDNYSTADEFKNNLQEQYESGNPVILYFPLATEDNSETVTLPQLKSFEDYTKIKVLTSVAPSKIEAEYVGYTLE